MVVQSESVCFEEFPVVVGWEVVRLEFVRYEVRYEIQSEFLRLEVVHLKFPRFVVVQSEFVHYAVRY